MNNGGDSLARGAASAQFGPAKVTQERWDAIWSEDNAACDLPITGEHTASLSTVALLALANGLDPADVLRRFNSK